MFKCRHYFEENVIMIYLLTLFLIDGYIIVIINNIDINNVSNIMTTATSFIMIAICADINECTEGISGCSDGCENSPGYFECSCPSGFTLSHEDNKTCIGKREKNIH